MLRPFKKITLKIKNYLLLLRPTEPKDWLINEYLKIVIYYYSKTNAVINVIDDEWSVISSIRGSKCALNKPSMFSGKTKFINNTKRQASFFVTCFLFFLYTLTNVIVWWLSILLLKQYDFVYQDSVKLFLKDTQLKNSVPVLTGINKRW